MVCTEPARAVHLQPGELHFGEAPATISTLLGSCVAITLWHPRWHIGGMCHYLLPSAGPNPQYHRTGQAFDGRYADQAMAMFLDAIGRAGSRPSEYEARIFGGGDQFDEPPVPGTPMDVASRNAAAGMRLLHEHGFWVAQSHVGGRGSRYVSLDLADGRVSIRHTQPFTPRPIP